MDDSYTIQISSNLINRLVGDENKVKKKAKKPKPKAPQQNDESVRKAASDSSNSQKSGGWPLQPPLYLPVAPPAPIVNPEVEAIRSVLQDSERTVERLQKQEDNMVQELTQRAKELHEKEFKLPYQKPMPCVNELSACQKCYKEHLKNPLTCSHLVRGYVNCTREARMQASSGKE